MPRRFVFRVAPRFAAGFGEAAFRNAARQSNPDPIPRALSLSAHIPFCFSPCFYCGCNRVLTRDARRGAPYLDRFPLLTTRDIARVQHRFLAALGIERVALVIGPSMGGMIAWEWAIDAPDAAALQQIFQQAANNLTQLRISK